MPQLPRDLAFEMLKQIREERKNIKPTFNIAEEIEILQKCQKIISEEGIIGADNSP